MQRYRQRSRLFGIGGSSGRVGPPPVGKAGFEVWVLTKGGPVCISNMQTDPYRRVSPHVSTHAHLLGRYAEPSGVCVYKYGPVTKCNPFLLSTVADRGTGRRGRVRATTR